MHKSILRRSRLQPCNELRKRTMNIIQKAFQDAKANAQYQTRITLQNGEGWIFNMPDGENRRFVFGLYEVRYTNITPDGIKKVYEAAY